MHRFRRGELRSHTAHHVLPFLESAHASDKRVRAPGQFPRRRSRAFGPGRWTATPIAETIVRARPRHRRTATGVASARVRPRQVRSLHRARRRSSRDSSSRASPTRSFQSDVPADASTAPAQGRHRREKRNPGRVLLDQVRQGLRSYLGERFDAVSHLSSFASQRFGGTTFTAWSITAEGRQTRNKRLEADDAHGQRDRLRIMSRRSDTRGLDRGARRHAFRSGNDARRRRFERCPYADASTRRGL